MNKDSATDHRKHGTGVPMLAAALLLIALPAALLLAATAPGPAIGTATLPAAGSVVVSLTVSLNLNGLHPAATKGGLECGAIAQTKAWVDANSDKLVDYDGVYHAVLAPAHYYGGKAILEFAVASGSYAGALTYKSTLSGGALVDSTTRAPYSSNPTVLVACWLQINGRPATWEQGTGLQVVSSSNFASVNSKPLVVAVAEVRTGMPVNATGQLSARGLYFSPRPVTLVENLSISGPNASASVPGTTASGPSSGTVAAAGAGAQTPPVLARPTAKPEQNAAATADSTPRGALANQLVAELANAGVALSSTDLNDLNNALSKGGAGGMAVAIIVVLAIGSAEIQQARQTGTTANVRLSQTQIDSMLRSITWGPNSALQISQILQSKLSQLKQRSASLGSGAPRKARTSEIKQTTMLAPQSANHSSLAAISHPNSGQDEQAKIAGIMAAVFAVDVAVVVAAIDQLVASFGADTTDADNQELAVAASLSTAAAVAAIVDAVCTIITQLPTLLQPVELVAVAPTPETQGGNASTGLPNQLTPQQINQVILSIPTTDASASRLSDDVKALLRKIKTRS